MRSGTVVNLFGVAPDGVIADVRAAAEAIVWPPGSHNFALPPHLRIGRRVIRHGNGVGPIKAQFRTNIVARGWQAEYPYKELGFTKGPFDAMHLETMTGAEWETGNISSSHRSANKLAGALVGGHIRGAILVLPDRDLYNYLTDRIGNLTELTKYLDYWSGYAREAPPTSFLTIMPVCYDEIRAGVSNIPKANDGNARMTCPAFVIEVAAGDRRFRVRTAAEDDDYAQLLALEEVQRRFNLPVLPEIVSCEPTQLWARSPVIDDVAEIH